MASGASITAQSSQISCATNNGEHEGKQPLVNTSSNDGAGRSHGNSHMDAHPPPTQLIKMSSLPGPPVVRKEKPHSSRFNVEKNRELNPLPLIKGELSVLTF